MGHRVIDVIENAEIWSDVTRILDFEGIISKAADHVKLDCSFEMSVVLSDDSFIQDLNARYGQKDKPTDVLSFPQNDFDPGCEIVVENLNLGDIILSYDTISRDAETQGKGVVHHITHMVVHGFLHLLGYDHQEERDSLIMEALERDILELLGVPDPYV